MIGVDSLRLKNIDNAHVPFALGALIPKKIIFKPFAIANMLKTGQRLLHAPLNRMRRLITAK
ncbi:hypothetical protein NHP22001_02810 [Helicobacter sp. NHP22-001]|nr:hypothetical protein NHP22001_02810 [Helicobacter sp. NHP22-001]